MAPAQDRKADNVAGRLDGSDGAFLFKVRHNAVVIVVVLVHEQQVAKVASAEHDNMIDALAADLLSSQCLDRRIPEARLSPFSSPVSSARSATLSSTR